MTTLGEVTHPDAPNGAVSVVVRQRAGALEEVTGGVRIEVPEAVRIEAVRIEAVRIEAVRIEAVPIATASAADRCSRPGSRDCQSRRSPMT
jgi:hypothetical protein